MNKQTVYIAHAVDTEGPMFESLTATFDRINDHYGISLEPSKETIRRLRNHEIDLDGKEELVAEIVREDMIGQYLESWDQIDLMHETIMSESWRNTLSDSLGKPYVLSWHCMDHVNFENNPRRRAMGFHAVYEYYDQLLRDYHAPRDQINWHFHPPSISRDAHRQSCGFNINMLHNEILARRIIDHKWFPVANRPGGHYETYDINLWLEAWIPFDIAHQFTGDPEDIKRIYPIPGRFVDWRGAPTDWRIYNPDFYDHRKEGSLKRSISRCLNLRTRYNNMNEKELERAFNQAQNGENAFVGVTNHDFRDMVPEIEEFVHLVRKVSTKYPEVNFQWVNVVEGFRAALGMEKKSPPKFKFELNSEFLRMTSDKDIWGSQPFLALRTLEGRYYRDDLINDEGNQWTYSFDVHSIALNALSHIGVACNDDIGNTIVYVYEQKSNTWEEKNLHQDDWI
jgi:hypothetical protein